MKSMIALIQREYLEHRGAFLYAPMVILVLLTLVLVGALGMERLRIPAAVATNSARLFELGFLAMAALWFIYLMASLFFYFADAFNADRRNNSMLFWKSMPASDFKILSSKMLAGFTIFPALIFVAMLVGGIIAYAMTLAAAMRVPGMTGPDLGALLGSAGQVTLFSLVYMMLALLWYAPFFAWVGSLSTLVGRWSIPLAFLIPGMLGVFENLIHDGGPRAGYILGYLRDRAHFGLNDESFEHELLTGQAFDAIVRIADLLVGIDWMQMAGGLIVATLFVYAASEYRRRMIIT